MFSARIELVMFTVELPMPPLRPPPFPIPSASLSAVLAEIVTLRRSTEAPRLAVQIPPPLSGAEFSVKVELTASKLAPFPTAIAPPFSPELLPKKVTPSARTRPFRVRIAPPSNPAPAPG